MNVRFNRRPGSILVLALGLLAGAPSAHASIFAVGLNGCQFSTVQEAINFAGSSAGEDEIRITNTQSYAQQAISIGAQNLTIVGGYATCAEANDPAAQPTANTILDGSGGSAAPVVAVTGSGFRILRNLMIRNGDHVLGNGGGCGGGIRFTGTGDLILTRVGIAQNDANVGGGLCFLPGDDAARLILQANTSVNNNSATSGDGGGIFINRGTLSVLEADTLIGFNEAAGDGGGIAVQSPARANIGSPGANGLGVLYGNVAQRGGALSAIVEEGTIHSMCVAMFTTDPTRPVRISQNHAVEGGAFFLRSNVELGNAFRANLALWDARIDDNTANNGPVAFLSSDDTFLGDPVGSRLAFNQVLADGCGSGLQAIGLRFCTNALECNRIEGNHAEDANGTPTNGNVVEVRDASEAYLRGLLMTGNTGTRVLGGSGGATGIYVERSAIVGNAVTAEIYRSFDSDGGFSFVDTTIGANAMGASSPVLRTEVDRGELRNTVIDAPGHMTLSHPNVDSGDYVNTWVIATETGSLRSDPTVQAGSARFTNPGRGDFRLRIGSRAVDYAPAPSPPLPNDLDLDRRPRNVDQENVSANTRARDLGGFERQIGDRWLVNGDFASGLDDWTIPDPTHATLDAGATAPGDPGGSLSYALPAEQVVANDRRVVATTCFNVPSGGTYEITGRALAPGATETARDYPIVSWRVRYDSADCSGAYASEGQGFFGRSASNWQGPAQPVMVPVDGAFTWNTTIEVRLEVATNPNAVTATAMSARFDAIEVSKPGAIDAIFRDGFE